MWFNLKRRTYFPVLYIFWKSIIISLTTRVKNMSLFLKIKSINIIKLNKKECNSFLKFFEWVEEKKERNKEKDGWTKSWIEWNVYNTIWSWEAFVVTGEVVWKALNWKGSKGRKYGQKEKMTKVSTFSTFPTNGHQLWPHKLFAQKFLLFFFF